MISFFFFDHEYYQALRFYFNLIKITYFPSYLSVDWPTIKNEAFVEFPVVMVLYRSTHILSHNFSFDWHLQNSWLGLFFRL